MNEELKLMPGDKLIISITCPDDERVEDQSKAEPYDAELMLEQFLLYYKSGEYEFDIEGVERK